jgi:hypothetical protein
MARLDRTARTPTRGRHANLIIEGLAIEPSWPEGGLLRMVAACVCEMMQEMPLWMRHEHRTRWHGTP